MKKTNADTGSIQRSLSIRTRPDLVISQSLFQGEASWIVKDPIALKYFRLREPEYEVLRLLNGQNSYSDLRKHLAWRFPNRRFDIRQLQQLVQSFQSSGLLLSDASGQATLLQRRHAKEERRKLAGLLSSIISIRFPGFDPEPVLAWLYPKVSWAFTRMATVCFLAAIMSALLLVGINFGEFRSRLPDFQGFFGIQNLVYLGFVLIVTKTIHEFGHGLMCKHFGGECHEMGFMLMVLTPAMYCDTSDSWTLPNKWRRIAIAAGGMWVEVVMAALATFVWWHTTPGWIHYFSLNVMFLSSVATIAFNINPLLRYDGYYMLSDLLEIPNLSQRSNQMLLDRLRVWCLGMEPISRAQLPTQNQTAFVLYSVSSFVYRWLIMAVIFWFLTKVFEPYGLAIVGYLAVGIALTGSVFVPLFKAAKYFVYPWRFRQVKAFRVGMTASLLFILLLFLTLVRLPHHVSADFVIQPNEADAIYVEWPGNLREVHVRHGDSVTIGTVIARLENPDLEIKIEELESELHRQKALLRSYRVDETNPLKAAQLAGEARATILRVAQQLEQRRKQQEFLSLEASSDGVVIPPPNIHEQALSDRKFSKWADTPLSSENLNAFLDRKTLVCYVGDPQDLLAKLTIAQEDLKYVAADQPVTMTFNSFRGQRAKSKIERVSTKPLDRLPRELSATNGGKVAATPNSSGKEVPMIPLFEASVQIRNSGQTRLMPGMTGQAKIHVGSATLATRAYRWIATLLKFR